MLKFLTPRIYKYKYHKLNSSILKYNKLNSSILKLSSNYNYNTMSTINTVTAATYSTTTTTINNDSLISPSDILSFWFDNQSTPNEYHFRILWFQEDHTFDELIRNKFIDTYYQAKEGKLNNWLDTLEGKLALIIIYDQFSRNLFRDSPDAFDCDRRAIDLANDMIDKNEHLKLHRVARTFVLLPYMHSESLEDQLKCMELHKDMDEANRNSALAHYETIKRFGRFPMRNKALSRKNTEEEELYLSSPDATF